MKVLVSYSISGGTTVPYPPLYDDIRQNHGFIDIRGRPDRVADIPEARQSDALNSLLSRLAQPQSRVVSLGCDLGQHNETKGNFAARRVAGGYVQVIACRDEDLNMNFLRIFTKEIEKSLEKVASSDRWEVKFELCPVHMKTDGELIVQSVWIWFYAKASSAKLALASRERLLNTIGMVVEQANSSTA